MINELLVDGGNEEESLSAATSVNNEGVRETKQSEANTTNHSTGESQNSNSSAEKVERRIST
jgi:hypothetical protein